MSTSMIDVNKKTSQIIYPDMRLISAGPFLMGSEDWGEYEGPVREIYLDDFLIGETHVTNKQFAAFINETGYITTAELKGFSQGYENGVIREIEGLCWRSYASFERENHPVVLVSWHDANEYAKWMDMRLPTEAEYEKAARGGLVQNLYPWGNDAPSITTCNFGKKTFHIPQTSAVRSFAPNTYGLYDMAGNVWSWCSDLFMEKVDDSDIGNFIGPKVRRGASFNIIQPFRLRCSNRGAYLPDQYAINIGFRCAKTY